MELQQLYKETKDLRSSPTMPLLFVGHGTPMNAIEDNPFTRSWQQIGKELPKPKAILAISAHWLTSGSKVTAMSAPKTIHDFGGFPQALFDQQYPAPGAVDFAEATIKLAQQSHIEADMEWGLDHGTWSVLLPMFPLADIPVYQLSIDYSQPPAYHYKLAAELKALRDKGVLIIGSGNIVHNLRAMRPDQKTYDWAKEFDQQMATLMENGDHQSILNFQDWGMISKLAHPTYDHLLPLFYVLGLQNEKDDLSFFNSAFDFGSISMRSAIFTS